MISGFLTPTPTRDGFVVLHTQLLDPNWFAAGAVHDVVAWLHGEGPNPFSCAAIGEAVSVAITFGVSKATRPLPEAHVEELFGKA